MSIETALVALVKTSAALGAQIGTPIPRFYPDVLPQSSAYPASVYQVISRVRLSRRLRTGLPQIGIDSELVEALVQITIFAKSASARATIGELFRTTLTGYTGVLSGTTIQRILPARGERDTFDPVTTTFEKQFDFPVQYNEA